jgi:spermidine/putrescine transport system substrate-binding protein
MNDNNEPIRLLMSSATANRLAGELSRRKLLGIGGSVAFAAFLAACGDDKSATGTEPTSDGDETAVENTSAENTGGGGNNSFKLFTWAEYDDPDLMESFGNIEITIFNSNEEAIQKLVASGGNGGFDMVCPTGIYIPQMASEGLLEQLDLTKLANFANLDPAYASQDWDPGNKYSVCKNWGTTGWIYDKSIVTTEIKTWADFIKVAQTEASGQTSIIGTAPNLCGMYFWANGMDWNTTDPGELASCEEFLVNEFASHIKAFDSYPGINLTQGNYALSMVWNGDARQGLNAVVAAGDDPAGFTWAIGGPETELWMDNWCILKDASNVDACYAFIDFILDPGNSATDIGFHGYNTGVLGSRELLPADAPFLDMVYFTDDEVSRMRAGSLDNQEAVVDIYNKVKAAAGA